MKPDNPKFAPFLRRRRAKLGLSIKQLADRLGMGKSSVHQWESGENIPGATRLPEIAEALEMPYEDFLAAAGFAVPKGLPTFAPYLRAKYGHLPEEAMEEAEKFLSELEAKYEDDRGDGS
jgi:transcriptional regulator with XRE-family HTH domain